MGADAAQKQGRVMWVFAAVGNRVAGYAAAVAAFMGLLAAAWLKGRSAGSAAARARAMDSEIKAAKERANADSHAGRESDPADRLRRDWSRD